MGRALEQDLYQYVEGVEKASQVEHGKLMRFIQNPFSMDLLACVLLASGLSSALMTLTGFSGGFGSCFGFACVGVLVIALLSRRWWIAPSAVTGSAAATALYLMLTDKLEAAVFYWSGFFIWVLNGARFNEAYSERAGEIILKAVIVFITVLFCFLLIRKLFSLAAVSLFASAALIAVYYFGRADLSVPLCVCASGIIILMPRTYSRYVSLKSGGGDGDGDKQRGTMQAVAVPAAVIAVLFAMFITPEDTSVWKSRGLNNIISDVSYLLKGPFSSYPASASNFSMKNLGFEQQDGRMGGPVQLSDDKYLSVTAEYPILLRGAVMDFYTGENWIMGAPDGDFRFDSIFWQGHKRDAFGLNKPYGDEAKRLFDELTATQTLTINYQTSKFSTLFAGGMLKDINFRKYGIAESIYFNMRSELYMHYRVPSFARLDLETRVWKTNLPDFEQQFLILEELARNRGDKYFSVIKERYTQLPDTLTEHIKELSLDITADSSSPYQKAKAIEKWLAENCEYTLKPVVPPENIDFVEHFLDTREGYCTYYASTMAVLARYAGLPSRYVTGFGLERYSNKGTLYIATGKTAHAWTEIYFDGIGWVEFDPLSWNPILPINSEVPVYTPDEPQYVGAPQGSDLVPEENPIESLPVRSAFDAKQILSILAAAAALCFAAWFAIYRIMRRKLSIYELSRVSRKIPDMGGRIDFYFDDILKQLSVLGIDAYAGETLTAFSKRADLRLRLESSSVGAVAKTRMLLHFAEAPPTIDNFKDAYKCHREIELLLKERLGRTAYFFKRAVRH